MSGNTQMPGSDTDMWGGELWQGNARAALAKFRADNPNLTKEQFRALCDVACTVPEYRGNTHLWEFIENAYVNLKGCKRELEFALGDLNRVRRHAQMMKNELSLEA